MKKLWKVITPYKIGHQIIKFGDTEIEKQKFHQHKSSILIYDVDINKIVVPINVPFVKKGFKCFIGYKDDRNVRSLFVILSRTSRYRRDFEENKYVFLIKNEELVENYNEIWNNVSNSVKKGFDNEHVYNQNI